MSENETVVIEEHTSSGQTLKPVFIYSREEYFDTPLPSQKSHQVSTLSVPRESPTIIAMPKNLPSYIMAGEYAVPNAQLVRRRIDYQETAEYRLVRPVTGSASDIDGRGDVSASLRKPLTVSMEESPKTAGDEKLSTGSSLSSSTRRRTRVSIIEPTDRVLRSQNRRGVSVIQRNMNYGIEQEPKASSAAVLEERELTPTPLASHNRHTAVRRRATEIEPEEPTYLHNLDVTPPDGGRAPTPMQSSRPSYGGGVNALTSRPWHLPSMLGLSAEPSYRSPSLHAEEQRRCHSTTTTTTTTDTSSSSHRTSCFIASLRHRLYSCLLNLIAIPLVLLHYLSVAVTAAGKAVACTLSSIYHRTTIRGSSNSSTKHSRAYRRSLYDEPGLAYPSNGSKGTGYRGNRSQAITSSLYCGRTPGYCCPLFILLLLLLLATLAGFLFRPAEVNPALDETPFFFGLLPSDAQCIRLAFANSHAYADDTDAGPFLAPHDLRWNCLSWSLWEPSIAALKRQSSVWWSWVQSLFQLDSSALIPSQPDSLFTQDSYQPITSLEGIDKLLERLRVINVGMTDLNRQVTELKKANQERFDVHTKEYGVISTDVSQLQAAIASLKEKIALIADKVAEGDGDEQRRQHIIDELVKQAAFVSTASLDARLQELRKQLEAMISGGVAGSTTLVGDQQTERIERFEKTLGELGALVMAQKSDLETKLKTLREELKSHKEEKVASLETLNAKISGDIVSTAAESHSNLVSLEKRLIADVEKISVRIGSIERLVQNLEQALQKLTSELASLQKTEASQQLISKARLEELMEEMKVTFSEKLALDLKQKIMKELAQTTETDPMTQVKVIDLIRRTVDEKLKETFGSAPKSTTGNIPAGVLAYIDSVFEVLMADGTGKADFALESAGGTVVSTRCTRTYTSFKSAISLFGITLAYWSRSPNEILQPSTHPGECWCFHGSEGQAIVRLAVPVHVTGVSLEHIPKSLAHTGRIDSAPRDFLIKALESDSAQDGEVLGSFTYEQDGKPIQYFPVVARSDGKPTLFVELVITSNHGHPEYTCVYRLRVHGHMATEADANRAKLTAASSVETTHLIEARTFFEASDSKQLHLVKPIDLLDVDNDACSIPTPSCSQLLLAAAKRLVIISILHKGEFNIAEYPLFRRWKYSLEPYMKLEEAFSGSNPADLHEVIEKNSSLFAADRNYGLVKQLFDCHVKHRIRNLTKTFMSLSVKDLAIRAHLDSPEIAEAQLLEMANSKSIFVKIDQRSGCVRFLDNPERYESPEVLDSLVQKLKATMRGIDHCAGRSNLVCQFATSCDTSAPVYKTGQHSSGLPVLSTPACKRKYPSE
ncbi:hypothetical protein TcWFU_000006 [Taenia crassiceps]|uniref:SUN domain-containing protein n=1 Tax=Taenia crassiceps TaxID=6207 RepID=A0ABR4Q8U7_9CEST